MAILGNPTHFAFHPQQHKAETHMRGLAILRWLWNNRSSILLAFILSITVWVAAVSADDPVIEQAFPSAVPIQYIGPAENLQIVGSPPTDARVVLKAPQSVWNQITIENFDLTVDISNLEVGTYQAILVPTISVSPAQFISIEPETIFIELEARASFSLPITAIINGEPALGYEAEQPELLPASSVVSGPNSAITQVVEILAELDITGARENLSQLVRLTPVDQDGNPVDNVTLEPASIDMSVQIEQGDRYRLLSVIPNIQGSPAEGYWITSIRAVPDKVIVAAAGSQTFEDLGTFVKTAPIVLTSAEETIERQLSLDIPEGFSLVGDQTVLVTVQIEPLEDSRTLVLELEYQALDPDLTAVVSPDTVTVFLKGPKPVLDALLPGDVQVAINLLELGVGSYQIEPQVIAVPEDVEVEILPSSIEVILTVAPSSTATPIQ
jgi:YbbR domain-containing protein